MRLFILMLTLVSCAAIPRISRKGELQRLVRLPAVEFSVPLQFDPKSGFVVFPDGPSAAPEAARILKEVNGTPSDGLKYLEAARLQEAEGEKGGALRHYSRALVLFRKRLEIEPADRGALLGLIECLSAFGKFAEAEAHLQKAAALGADNVDYLLAVTRFYRERVWHTLAGDRIFFGSAPMLEGFAEVLGRLRDSSKIAEAKQYLKEAEEFLARAGELAAESADVHLERSIFLSFRALIEEGFRQAQAQQLERSQLERAVLHPEAINALAKAALATKDPRLLAAAAFATASARELHRGVGAEIFAASWPVIGSSARRQLLEFSLLLEAIGAGGGKNAAAALEWLGCVQMYLLGDFAGGQRSFEQALEIDPKRHRSWDLLIAASVLEGQQGALIESCQRRNAALPGARSSAFLVKAYERVGDSTRAEWTALQALTAHPNDFVLNLSFAALLLRKPNAESYLWRIKETISKAEKQLSTTPPEQAHLDFVLVKCIYLALANQVEDARTVLNEFSGGRNPPAEIEELQRLLAIE